MKKYSYTMSTRLPQVLADQMKKICDSDAFAAGPFFEECWRDILPPVTCLLPPATCLLPLAICLLTQGLAAEAYAFRSAAARSCLRANAGVLSH